MGLHFLPAMDSGKGLGHLAAVGVLHANEYHSDWNVKSQALAAQAGFGHE